MQATTKQKIFGINKQTWHTIEFSNNKHPRLHAPQTPHKPCEVTKRNQDASLKSGYSLYHKLSKKTKPGKQPGNPLQESNHMADMKPETPPNQNQKQT